MPRGWVPLDSHEIVHVHWTASMQMKRQLSFMGWQRWDEHILHIHLCSELLIVTTLTNPAVFHIISSQNSHPPKKNHRLPNPNTKLHLKKFESVETKEPPSHQKKHRIPSHHLSRWRDVSPAADSAGRSSLLLLWGPPTPRRFFRVMEASPMRTHTNLRLPKNPNMKAMLLHILPTGSMVYSIFIYIDPMKHPMVYSIFIDIDPMKINHSCR